MHVALILAIYSLKLHSSIIVTYLNFFQQFTILLLSSVRCVSLPSDSSASPTPYFPYFFVSYLSFFIIQHPAQSPSSVEPHVAALQNKWISSFSMPSISVPCIQVHYCSCHTVLTPFVDTLWFPWGRDHIFSSVLSPGPVPYLAPSQPYKNFEEKLIKITFK